MSYYDLISISPYSGVSRYDYTHEILANDQAFIADQIVTKFRRISVVCRNE
jgi:alkylated DNA repair protein alkB family protein 7